MPVSYTHLAALFSGIGCIVQFIGKIISGFGGVFHIFGAVVGTFGVFVQGAVIPLQLTLHSVELGFSVVQLNRPSLCALIVFTEGVGGVLQRDVYKRQP